MKRGENPRQNLSQKRYKQAAKKSEIEQFCSFC
jgi:hypothetical protein